MVRFETTADWNNGLVRNGSVFKPIMDNPSGNHSFSNTDRDREWYYFLKVVGRIPEERKDRLFGLRVSTVANSGGVEMTTLEGKLVPGATLGDVYDMLKELGLRVEFDGGFY